MNIDRALLQEKVAAAMDLLKRVIDQPEEAPAAIVDLNMARAQLAVWLLASLEIATAGVSEVDRGDGKFKKFTVNDTSAIRGNVEYWERRVAALSHHDRRRKGRVQLHRGI